MILKRIFLSILMVYASALNWGGVVVFEEEFDGNHLDENKWAYDYFCDDRYGPNNLQCYNKNNIEVRNGKLIITAKEEHGGGKNFTSGRIHQLASFAYGAFVVKARLARGDHLWPAIWLINDVTPNSCRYEEIDIAEYRGQASQSNKIELTGHWGKSHDALTSMGVPADTSFDLSEDFHEYAVLWTTTHITWYIDDDQYHQVSLSDPGWTSDPNKAVCGRPPFSLPEHFVLNLGVGGEFFKEFKTFDPSTWSRPNMVIDWVRVYQEQANQPTSPQSTGPDTILKKVLGKMKEFTNM